MTAAYGNRNARMGEQPFPGLHKGLCVGEPNDSLWFAEGVGRHIAWGHAKAICADCPVIYECRQWALATGQPYGVFGGLDEEQREALRTARLKAAS